MNKTISIYLQETGSNALIDMPCRLYKGSYKDKLINVYVPKSLLYEVQDAAIVQTINIGAVLTAENGTQTTTVPYYPDYVQDEIVNGVEYAVYSLSMPNTFTAFVGTQTAVVNIVNIDNTDATSPLVLEIVTTQSVNFTINQSANISQEEVIEADQVTVINGQIQDIQTTLALKQNIQEPTLTTTNKTIPTSINEINSQAQSNASTIATQTTQITNLQSDVAELQAKLAGAEIPIGSMSGTTMPTNAQLTAYTVQQTGNQPQPNNVIIFTLEVEGGTDRVFKYIYVSTDYGWTYYEIPAIEHASNGTYGSLQGTYGIDSTNNVLVNIMDGEIVDIYYKDGDGIYQNIQSSINLIKGTQDGILDGTQIVARATEAIQDQLGNVINLTYAEADDVYTKTESDNKYLPKTYTNIYYYSQEGLVDDVPTTPANGIQFAQNVNTIGETEICSVSRTTTAPYHFTKNSSDNSSIVLATSADFTLQFRLETYANDSLLSVDLTDTLSFVANTPQTIDITSIYSNLGTTELDIETGSTISKKLYAISTSTNSVDVYLYSNATYPSTYQLNAQSIVLTLNTINGLKAVNISDDEWTDNGNNTYTVVIPQTRHQQPASTKYMLELQKQVTANSYQYIAFTPIVSDAGDITITTNEAIDCVLLIGSNLASDERGIMTITNPTVAQEINYNLFGAMKVTQTNAPTSLSLLAPQDAGKFYTFYIVNDVNSTENIIWNDETIEPGVGTQFKWNGSAWMVGEQPSATDEVYDKDRDQLLSVTLSGLQSSINANTNGITTLTNSKANVTLSNVSASDLNNAVASVGTNDTRILNFNTTGFSVETSNLASGNIIANIDFSGVNASSSGEITLSNTSNVKKIDIYAKTNDYQSVLVLYTDTDVSINNGADLYIPLCNGYIGTIYFTGISSNIRTFEFVPNIDNNTSYAKGDTTIKLTASNAVNGLSVPTSQIVSGGDLFNSAGLLDYGNMSGSSENIVKVVLEFGTATAPSQGDITVKIGNTVIGTKTYVYDAAMTPLAVGAFLTSSFDGQIKITSTMTNFPVNISAWHIEVMSVDRKRTSDVNNAFDIATGTKWDIDYTNKTITLKD